MAPSLPPSERAALTGTPAQVARVAKKFRVYFSEVDANEDDEDYLGASISPGGGEDGEQSA